MQVKRRALKADSEKTQEDRNSARATKKRVSKRKQQEKEELAGVWAHDKGIKSARQDAEAAREAAAMRKRGKRGRTAPGQSPGGAAGKKTTTGGSIATNSTDVFKSLEAAKAGGSGETGRQGEPGAGSAKFMY